MSQDSNQSLRIKLWQFQAEEEKSMLLLNAYKARILKSQDLKQFMTANRVHVWTTWLFPVAATPILSFLLKSQFYEFFFLQRPKGTFQAALLASVVASWTLWVNFSPFYTKLEQSKEDLLEIVWNRIGTNMSALTDVVPRYWTSQEVNRRIIKLYNERNSFLSGYLYPTEEKMDPLVDIGIFYGTRDGEALCK